MRVLLVNKYLYPRDGVTTVVAQTMRLLTRRDHAVMAFGQADERNFTAGIAAAYVHPIDLEDPQCSARRCLGGLGRILLGTDAVPALERFLADAKPDVAHVHNIYHHLSPRILAVLARRGIPVVMTLHDYKLFCPDYLFLRPTPDGPRTCTTCLAHGPFDAVRFRCVKRSALASMVCFVEALMHRRLWSRVHTFVAPSAFMAAKAAQAGIPRRKLVVVPNATPAAARSVAPKADPPRILFLGRLYPEKGTRLLIEAFARADTRGATLVIAGEGPEREALAAQTRACNARVVFPGFLEGEAKSRALAEATVLAFPSTWYENCPMAILEAFAHATPVIASRIGGIPEIVKNRFNGLLVPPGDTQALAGALSTLCVDPELAARLGRAAVQDAARDFSEDRYARQLEAVYAAALA